jgi:8-oxo-dGTP pyrophosphatase MutT (NUDIX family)
MNHSGNFLCKAPDFQYRVERALMGRAKRTLPRDDCVVAAVLVPLFIMDGEAHVLLTKRSQEVEHHRGEISFPGGKLDETDANLLSCALRETHEEVGIHPSAVSVVGELDEFHTVATGFLVAPFVGIIPYPYELRPSRREIDEVLHVPLEVFFDPSRKTTETWTFKGVALEITAYKWNDHTIWGATARIMNHFVDVLSGLSRGSSSRAPEIAPLAEGG